MYPHMNLWEKLMTALRGGVRETGEAIMDSQALRILDQEISEAEHELKNSRSSLVELIAREKLGEEKKLDLKSQITIHENYARQALLKKEQVIATELAEKISELQIQLTQEKSGLDFYHKNVNQLRTSIKLVEDNIKSIKSQVEQVKITDNIQRAQKDILAHHRDSNLTLHEALESLERIKENQALEMARTRAISEIMSQTTDQSLKQRLKDAGIPINGQTVDEILLELKSSVVTTN